MKPSLIRLVSFLYVLFILTPSLICLPLFSISAFIAAFGSLSACLLVCWSFCLLVSCLLVGLLAGRLVDLSVCLFVCLPFCLLLGLSAGRLIDLSVFLLVCLSACRLVCLSGYRLVGWLVRRPLTSRLHCFLFAHFLLLHMNAESENVNKLYSKCCYSNMFRKNFI